jgi:hypothetical protein
LQAAASWILLPGLASFLLTPVTLAFGAWCLSRSLIDRRIKVIMACFLAVQAATALCLPVALFLSGGRLPH